ncbi:flagellar protein FlaG [Undibacterium cyanobacteriorum]|uniref:Flagellar protein FlaG n=1 Tax=Undibacterium cyanobacteriorum TaxID=3073561 RepID=A0ABY9RJF1_9BURK|nr:flagellar protein FlaG [Undibacterium sp. 20NA77.5]WMW80487.1 flagellar protein FlaG [Undibacterium sp. 20NA77.5]
MNINQVSGGVVGIPASSGTLELRPSNKPSVAPSVSNPVTPTSRSDLSAPVNELSEAEVRKTVEQLNQMMNANNGVNFKVDQGSGRMVIQVVDRETNTVVRQIPSKEIIEISKALEGKTGVLLKDKA